MTKILEISLNAVSGNVFFLDPLKTWSLTPWRVFTKNSIKSKTVTIKHSVETQCNSLTNFLTNLLLINLGLKQLQIKARLRSKRIVPIYQALLS